MLLVENFKMSLNITDFLIRLKYYDLKDEKKITFTV